MVKATFILYRKNGPSVVLLSIPTTPAKGDLVYVCIGCQIYVGTLILIQRKNMK